jgi:pyridoxal phosphate enzyme (YggS family)
MDHIVDIEENVKRVRGAIAEAAIKSGRAPGDIMLVAAAKTKPAGDVLRAVEAGCDAIGENRVMEMLEKREQGAYQGAPLHFIGHLQSNKARRVIGVCDLIESVHSVALIGLIGQKAQQLDITQDILIEVNIGREPQKSGIMPERVEEILALASETKGVNVLGLMAIPPISEENVKSCNFFDVMFHLFVDMRAKIYDNVSMQFLSMGMSDSFAEAICSGANIVRVGSAIFGARL